MFAILLLSLGFFGAEPVCREMNYICLVDDYNKQQKQLKKEKLRDSNDFFFLFSFK